MLKLIIDSVEIFNEETQEFGVEGGIELELEHSLASMSKWESKTKKPFLTKEGKSNAEIMSYIECMILTPNYPPNVVDRFSPAEISAVTSYIESTESATTFGDMPERKGRGEIITSELIYYWMVAFNIPFECEMWHLNRLFSLIRICNIKNQKPKKMGRGEMQARNARLNAERRAKLGTSG